MLVAPRELQVGALFRRQCDVPERLWRVIAMFIASDELFVVRADQFDPNRNTRMPVRLPLSVARHELDAGELVIVDDCVRSAEMLRPETEIPEKSVVRRDADYAMLEPFISDPVTLRALLDPDTRAQIAKTIAERGAVALPKVYRLLSRYWVFGADRNALLPRHSRQGGRGKVRLGGEVKRGRRNAYTLRHGVGPMTGTNVTAKDLRRFEKAIHEYYVKQNLSLPKTYEKMCQHIYVAWNRLPDGKREKHPIHPAKIPSLEQFRRRTQALVRDQDVRRRKAGDLDHSQYDRMRVGSASDIALGPTDIYDMDVGVLKCIAVTEGVRPEPLGPVSVALCIDRASRACVGFHIFLGAERWQHYRLALFWAFVGAAEHLRVLGVTEFHDDVDKHFVHGWCNKVYVDRGPGRGAAAYSAIVDELGLGRAVAPTERGDLKACVESIVGRFQNEVADLPGGYSRKKGRRHEDRAKAATDAASLKVQQIRRCVIAAIADHNRFHPVPDCLTADMVKDGVKPYPIDIFRWGQRALQVTNAPRLSMAELYKRMLPHADVRVTRQGVRHQNAHFASSELALRFHPKLSASSRTIRIYWDELRPQSRYWTRPDGSLGELQMVSEDMRKFNGMSWEEFDAYLIRERAIMAVGEVKRRKANLVSKAKQAVLAEIAGAQARPKPLLSVAKNREVERVKLDEPLRGFSRSTLGDLVERAANVVIPASAPPPMPGPTPERPLTTAELVFQRRFKRSGRTPGQS